MGGGLGHWVNTTDKFITEVIYKIKKKWLKADKVKMNDLLKKQKEIDKERDNLQTKLNKLISESIEIHNKIYVLNKKYTYKRKVKVENKYYNYYGNLN